MHVDFGGRVALLLYYHYTTVLLYDSTTLRLDYYYQPELLVHLVAQDASEYMHVVVGGRVTRHTVHGRGHVLEDQRPEAVLCVEYSIIAGV